MQAQNFGQEINGKSNMIDELSDDELLTLRSEIIKDLKQD